MAEISQIFPDYTGDALSRSMTPAEFNAAEIYYQAYHAQFVPIANTWSDQANILRNEINQIYNDTLVQQGIMSTYLKVTKQARDEAQDYANASETSYQNTETLLKEVDIAGTGGYTVEAVDDLMSRQRNLHLVGLNLI